MSTTAKKTAAKRSAPAPIKTEEAAPEVKAEAGDAEVKAEAAAKADAAAKTPASGPLDAPAESEAKKEEAPVYEDNAGPRDVFDYPEAGGRKFVNEDGEELAYDDMFEDEGKTYVVSKLRIFEVFYYPNTTTLGRRLAYSAGRRVPRGEALNVKGMMA